MTGSRPGCYPTTALVLKHQLEAASTRRYSEPHPGLEVLLPIVRDDAPYTTRRGARDGLEYPLPARLARSRSTATRETPSAERARSIGVSQITLVPRSKAR